MRMALCTMSAGRFSPLGPRRLSAVLKESPEKLHKLVLALAAFIQEGGYVHLVGAGAVTGPAHVAALLFVLDKQAVGVRVEHQAPSVLVGAFSALV
jgi:hypothetical protein